MYPLQTHVIVCDIAPSCIAQNIEACLKKLSITAFFDNDKAMANAQTNDHIKFNIRLFANNHHNSHKNIKSHNNNHSTIVELNRMSTPQLGFHQIVVAIFQSAQGKSNSIQILEGSCKRRKVHPIHIPSTCLTQSQSQPKTKTKIATEAISRVAHLLNKDRYDANALGMESMMFLTNQQHSSEGVAQLAAKSILCSEENLHTIHMNIHGVQDKIYNLVMYGKMNLDQDNYDDFGDDNHDDEEECDLFLKSHFDKMRSNALTVLLHSLETMSSLSSHSSHTSTTTTNHDNINHNHNSSLLDGICCDMWLEKDLADVLLNDVRSASSIPHGAHTAHLAVKCLHMMHSHSSVFRSRMQEMEKDVEDIVHAAICAGHGSHDLLAKESECFMSCLKCI